MKNVLILVVIALTAIFGFTNAAPNSTAPNSEVVCNSPTFVTLVGTTSSSFTCAWIGSAPNYIVKYYSYSQDRMSVETTISASSHTFSGLSSGTYKFYVASKCGSEVSEFIVIDDLDL